eukprot:symbB.v1.2.028152.t1/scaffold2954.1/size66569/9
MQVDFAGEEFDGRPEEETVMYNLVGHELAQLIEECNGLAGNVLGLRAEGEDEDVLHRYFERTVRMTVQRFRHVGATEQGIRREVQSMMLDPMTDWNSSSLPGTTQSLQSPDRPSEPPAKSVKAVKRAARSSSSERSASTKKKSVAKNKAETETEPCNGSPGSPDSDSDSFADSAGNVDSQGIAEGMAVNTLDDQNNVEGSESDLESQASQAQPEVAPTQPEEEQEPPLTPQVTSIPLRRQPARRRLVGKAEAGTSEALRWRYIAPDGQERLAIRAYPGMDAPTTGGSLGSGEVFTVNQEKPGDNGVLFLRLADGRGWVFNRKSGLWRRRKARPLCVPYQVSLVDEQGSGKVRKRVRRPANAHPKAKRRRRQHAVVTSTVIEVDSDGDAPKAPTKAGGNVPKAAKERLRVQLERKQQEVEALRQKLLQMNTQQELGKKRSASTRALEGDPKVAPGWRAQVKKWSNDEDFIFKNRGF